MLPGTNAREIKVSMVGAAVACLAVAVFLVAARHKRRSVAMSEEHLASIRENLALCLERVFTEISDTEDFFAGLTNRVNQLIRDEFSQKQGEALLSLLGIVLIARSEGDWEKHRRALSDGMTAQFPGM